MPRCIHCPQETGDTRDHVFPKSWYPAGTPSQVQRPTAPSCARCNGEFGAIENELLRRLGLCLDPGLTAAQGIPETALRSIGIGVGQQLSEKEKRIRRQVKKQLMQEMAEFGATYDGHTGLLPGFGPREGFARESQPPIPVKEDSLRKVACKVVRGLEHHIDGNYVEPPRELTVHFLPEPAAQQLSHLFKDSGLYLGPGFQVHRAQSQEDLRQVLYRLRIWDTLVVHASIVTPEFLTKDVAVAEPTERLGGRPADLGIVAESADLGYPVGCA